MSGISQPRIGILGAGQLALMLAQAAGPLGLSVLCAGQPGDCAEQAARVVPVDLTDAAAVARFAREVDLLTIESENIDAEVLRGLPLYPNEHAIAVAQERLAEKEFFRGCGIGTAAFAAVDSAEELAGAMEATGLPAILKTRRMGYDGKGQVRLQGVEEGPAAWEENGGVPCLLEGMVAFEAEVSLVGARGRDGEIVFYPLIENVHREGILRKSTVPSLRPDLQALAEAHVTSLLQALDYVGVLAVEFFVQGNTLLANEMAPRVHNSGHWTIEGAATSQFANHLRAIAGMPLGNTASEPTVMLNCIGTMPPARETAAFPQMARHDYGKEARPGRKVGHLTFPAGETAAIAEWDARLRAADL